jgi:adenosine deaminase
MVRGVPLEAVIRGYGVFAMLKAGTRVTVSSDDPPYFGGHVDQNYNALVAAGVTPVHLERLARNSFDAAFISDTEHSSHLAALTAWSAAG